MASEVLKYTCTKEELEVETEKGTYTFPLGKIAVGKCAAEEECTKRESILAPFTEKSEFLAVMGAVNSCDHKDVSEPSYVGLNIAKDNSTRVFSTGVPFDYKTHGDLYQENEINMPTNCPEAYFWPLSQDKVAILPAFKCQKMPRPYVCFKQKTVAKSEAVSSDAMDVNSMNVNSKLLMFGGLFQLALVCLVCFMFLQNKKLKSKKSQEISDLA